MKTSVTIPFLWISTSIVTGLWIVSLTLPAYLPNSAQPQLIWGMVAAVKGVFALSILCPAGLANPALFIGVYYLLAEKCYRAIFFGALAFLLTGSTFLIYAPDAQYPVLGIHSLYPGILGPCIKELHVGFYVWVASPLALIVSGFLGAFAVPSDSIKQDDSDPDLSR